MIGLVRGTFTLIGAAVAGFLIWLASYFDLESTGEFWGAMGLIAGAGLALGLSQLFGGWTKWGWPRISPGVFLLGFLPTLVMSGWILLVTQPGGGWQQARLEGWSGSIGILDFVEDIGLFRAALAFGFGLVLSFVFDTTGPRERVVEREHVVPGDDVHDFGRRETVTRAPAGERVEIGDPPRR